MDFTSKLTNLKNDSLGKHYSGRVKNIAVGCTAFISAPDYKQNDCIKLSEKLNAPFKLGSVEKHLVKTIQSVSICELYCLNNREVETWLFVAITIPNLALLCSSAEEERVINVHDLCEIIEVTEDIPNSQHYSKLYSEWLFSKEKMNVLFTD